jgi:hypothetical protein
MERTKLTNKETVGIVVVMYIMLFVGMIYGFVMGWCTKEREDEFEEV